MSRTSLLFELQQLDTQGDDALRRALAINAALGETESLRGVREAHTEAVAALEAAHEVLRPVSHEVDKLSDHLALQSGRLYDGSVKNPKELAAIQHDVTYSKQVKAAKEDLLLEAMEAVEQRQAALDEATRQLELAETEWQRRQDGMLEEKDAVDSRLRALRTHREKLAADVPPADLQLYERLRKAKRGVAVAAMVHDICQACRVAISGGPAVTAKQGTTFVNCPSCGRILHPGERGDLVR
ncbi:MAG: zinc ribbon domain-containing protein [Chloroflexia bacterium]